VRSALIVMGKTSLNQREKRHGRNVRKPQDISEGNEWKKTLRMCTDYFIQIRSLGVQEKKMGERKSTVKSDAGEKMVAVKNLRQPLGRVIAGYILGTEGGRAKVQT